MTEGMNTKFIPVIIVTTIGRSGGSCRYARIGKASSGLDLYHQELSISWNCESIEVLVFGQTCQILYSRQVDQITESCRSHRLYPKH